MALLTKDIQERVVSVLQDEGLIDTQKLAQIRQNATLSKQPILATLIAQKLTSSETITHATAEVMKVPYVNLKNVKIEQEILLNMPQILTDLYSVLPYITHLPAAGLRHFWTEPSFRGQDEKAEMCLCINPVQQ